MRRREHLGHFRDPVSDPLDEAHVLNQGFDDLPSALRRARAFNYDYSSIHLILVDARRGFAVCATGFRDAPLAGADSESGVLGKGRKRLRRFWGERSTSADAHEGRRYRAMGASR